MPKSKKQACTATGGERKTLPPATTVESLSRSPCVIGAASDKEVRPPRDITCVNSIEFKKINSMILLIRTIHWIVAS